MNLWISKTRFEKIKLMDEFESSVNLYIFEKKRVKASKSDGKRVNNLVIYIWVKWQTNSITL